jgi:hypothetical protein
MIFSLEVRRARKGDCLLLHFGSNDDTGLIMIDGGPKNVYKPHLKPRLEQIRIARGLSNQDSLPVDLLMVSHVDDDHIQGILDLTKEMIEAQDERKPQPLRVLSFWHNSFDDIIDTKPEELTAAFRSQFGAAAVSGELPADATIEVDDDAAELTEEIVVDNLKVLASIEQGYRLRIDAEKLDFPRNPEFDGKLIIATKDTESIDMGRGLTFTVAGPMKPEVEALRKKHEEWLRKLEEKGKSPPEALAAYIDKSVPNLSSLVLLAEGGGKRMLLTGDARGDKSLRDFSSSVSWVAAITAPSMWTCLRFHITAVPTIWSGTSSSASPRTITCFRVTASTATLSARRWKCSTTPAAAQSSRCT